MNHPERIQPDRHRAGSPLPRANLHNSIGYLPDGTPLNAAGNAINHPERMKPDTHVSGSPLPKSVHSADVGYFADGTDLKTAGNNSVKDASASECVPTSALVTPVPTEAVAPSTTELPKPAAEPAEQALHGTQFGYSLQKDAYADLEFINDVGFLDDGEWIVCCREFFLVIFLTHFGQHLSSRNLLRGFSRACVVSLELQSKATCQMERR